MERKAGMRLKSYFGTPVPPAMHICIALPDMRAIPSRD
jgi:hypothetical protein